MGAMNLLDILDPAAYSALDGGILEGELAESIFIEQIGAEALARHFLVPLRPRAWIRDNVAVACLFAPFLPTIVHWARTVSGLFPVKSVSGRACASQVKSSSPDFGAGVARVVGKGKKEKEFARDEHPRPDTTPEALAGLRPYFKEGGTVTAGNASGIGDGAAAVVVASGEWAARRGLRPMGRLVSWGVAGVEPTHMGIGPAPASRLALENAGLTLGDIDLVEINEAFGSQYCAVE